MRLKLRTPKTRTRILRWTLLIVLIFLHSCSEPIQPANRALGMILQGQRKQAWELIEKELNAPQVTSTENLCEMHAAAVQILNTIAQEVFFPKNGVDIAGRSLAYVTHNCGAYPNKMGVAENQFANLMLKANMPGRAVTHLKSALKYSRKGSWDETANICVLATVYSNLGIQELRDHYREQSIRLGTAYFSKPQKYRYALDESLINQQYKDILLQRIDEKLYLSAGEPDWDYIIALWQSVIQINETWVAPSTQYLDYFFVSMPFAMAGRADLARQVLQQAEQLTQANPHQNTEIPKLDLMIAEAIILSVEDNPDAIRLTREWQQGITKYKTLTANDYRLLGLIYEKFGHYREAIELFDKSITLYDTRRSSFQVKARAGLFSSQVATAYWGMARSHAQLYKKTGEASHFLQSLQAARRLKARQFGELLGMNWQEKINISDLKINRDEVLVNYVLTDSDVLIYLLGFNTKALLIIPYDQEMFNRLISGAKTQIVNKAKPGGLNDLLLEISRYTVKPIAPYLKKGSRVTIVTDGYLSGLPISMLSKSEGYKPLVVEHEVKLIPSLAYRLGKMKRATLKQSKNSRDLFALGDPAYSGESTHAPSESSAERDYRQRTLEVLKYADPLPETRMEINHIASLFPADRVKTLLGAQATETNVKKTQLKDYRYLHFATHGVLGNQIQSVYEPALAMGYENSSQDGFLTMSEVEGLELSAELVVLSACDTGNGEIYTGEGVMGLGRSFLLSGSNFVLVSLWPVSNQATVEFMKRFYSYMTSGLSKAQSLRQTQLDFLGPDYDDKKGRGIADSKTGDWTAVPEKWQHPVYWAPFVLVGY